MRLFVRLFKGSAERRARLEEERRQMAEARARMQEATDRATRTIQIDMGDPQVRAAISGIVPSGDSE